MIRMRISLATLLCALLAGCASLQGFPTAARPGDTIGIALGWNAALSRQNASVLITPTAGPSVALPANDPRIRAVVRLYPDPVSRLLVGTETEQALGTNAQMYGRALLDHVTGQDKDWWLTMLFLDLPPELSPGFATITVTGLDGPVGPQPLIVEVLPGRGQPASLAGAGLDPAGTAELLGALERADHATVTFAGEAVPQSIQLELTHTPQVGKPWLVNPRGDLKNMSWSDDGATLKVILTASHAQALRHVNDLKFYIAGGLTDLRVKTLKIYDAQGRPMAGILAVVQ